MELEVSLPASHPFPHCRTPEEWDWIELLMGLHVCLCVCPQKGGLQSRRTDKNICLLPGLLTAGIFLLGKSCWN